MLAGVALAGVGVGVGAGAGPGAGAGAGEEQPVATARTVATANIAITRFIFPLLIFPSIIALCNIRVKIALFNFSDLLWLQC